MPFVALRDDEQAGRVYIGDYDDPRQALAGATLICPDCRMPMIVKQGAVVCPHFAHKAGDKKPCYWREHSESPEHLLAKRAIIEYLNNEPKPFGDCVIEVEYPVVTPGGKKRYIDVYVETEDGDRFACEAQLSRQSLTEFATRTADYRAIDIEPIWFLGGETRTNENEIWCERNCYCYGAVSIGSFSRHIDTAHFNSDGRITKRTESLI